MPSQVIVPRMVWHFLQDHLKYYISLSYLLVAIGQLTFLSAVGACAQCGSLKRTLTLEAALKWQLSFKFHVDCWSGTGTV